jgi:hypothetical protein
MTTTILSTEQLLRLQVKVLMTGSKAVTFPKPIKIIVSTPNKVKKVSQGSTKSLKFINCGKINRHLLKTRFMNNKISTSFRLVT